MSMLVFGIVFINMALILYTTAVFSERFFKKIKIWMIYVFVCAFVCDLVGTGIMFLERTKGINLNIHSILGYASLVIMFLHLLWLLLSAFCGGKWNNYFHRFSVYAWCSWFMAFLSGIFIKKIDMIFNVLIH